MLCGDLNGKEVQKRGDICICMANSLCCTVESSIVKQPYSDKINLKNNKSGRTQRDGVGREEGGGFRMGSTSIPVSDSF